MRRGVCACHPGRTCRDGLCHDEVSWARFLPPRRRMVPKPKEPEVRFCVNPEVFERPVPPVESKSKPLRTVCLRLSGRRGKVTCRQEDIGEMPFFQVPLVPETSAVRCSQESDKGVNIGQGSGVAHVAPVQLPSSEKSSPQRCASGRVGVSRCKNFVSSATLGLDGTVRTGVRVVSPSPYRSCAIFCDCVQGDTASQAVKNWSNTKISTVVTFRTVEFFELVHGQIATQGRVICVFQGFPCCCLYCSLQ